MTVVLVYKSMFEAVPKSFPFPPDPQSLGYRDGLLNESLNGRQLLNELLKGTTLK